MLNRSCFKETSSGCLLVDKSANKGFIFYVFIDVTYIFVLLAAN